MVDVEHIADWRGQDVVDREGEKLGKLADVWFRVGTNDAVFATVKSGLLGRHATVVPLAGASLSRDYVRLGVSKEQTSDAPAPEESGLLSPEDGGKLAESFGLEMDASIGWESAAAREARLERAAGLRQRAGELDAQAESQATRADELRRRAEEAARDAEEADRAAKQAREDAEQAREQADEEERPPKP